MLFGLGAPELIVIALVILVLFGSRKIEGTTRSFARSMRIFKSETREMKADEERARAAHTAQMLPPGSTVVTRADGTQVVGTTPVAGTTTVDGAPVSGAPVAATPFDGVTVDGRPLAADRPRDAS